MAPSQSGHSSERDLASDADFDSAHGSIHSTEKDLLVIQAEENKSQSDVVLPEKEDDKTDEKVAEETDILPRELTPSTDVPTEQSSQEEDTVQTNEKIEVIPPPEVNEAIAVDDN